mgnify:CR=1 FL=1
MRYMFYSCIVALLYSTQKSIILLILTLQPSIIFDSLVLLLLVNHNKCKKTITLFNTAATKWHTKGGKTTTTIMLWTSTYDMSIKLVRHCKAQWIKLYSSVEWMRWQAGRVVVVYTVENIVKSWFDEVLCSQCVI